MGLPVYYGIMLINLTFCLKVNNICLIDMLIKKARLFVFPDINDADKSSVSWSGTDFTPLITIARENAK